MHQTANTGGTACIRKCRHRDVMHFFVRFGATLTQDANAVQYHVHLCEHGLPGIGIQQLLESHSAAFAAMRLQRQATPDTFRVAAADDDLMLAGKQRRNSVASNEPRAAQHQNAHSFNWRSTIVRSERRQDAGARHG